MATKNPYTVLGLSKDASQEDVKNAYRKLAKKHHPDLNPGNKESEKKFKEVNGANDILGDPKVRAKFDRGEIDETGTAHQTRGHDGPQSPYHGQQGPYYYETQQDGGRYSSSFGNMGGDFFESLFRNSRRQNTPTAGEDHAYSLEVELRDAALGAEREITLPTGKKLKVKIPPGMESGKKLRLKGQGGAGVGSGPAGDAYIEIIVRPSDTFTRSGQNLEMDLLISLSEAVLGGDVTVPTLESSVLLTIPKGANTGARLRIRGKGAGSLNSSERGDLIVTLKVAMPPKIDAELEEAIRKWSKTHSYDPREQIGKRGGHS